MGRHLFLVAQVINCSVPTSFCQEFVLVVFPRELIKSLSGQLCKSSSFASRRAPNHEG